MSDYDGLVDMTCWVRHLQGWEDGPRALREYGIEPNEAICTYLGPGGNYATCDILLPDGRFLCVDVDRDPATGHAFVPKDNVEEFRGDQPNEKLAREIFTSDALASFNADVGALYERKHRPLEPVIKAR